MKRQIGTDATGAAITLGDYVRTADGTTFRVGGAISAHATRVAMARDVTVVKDPARVASAASATLDRDSDTVIWGS